MNFHIVIPARYASSRLPGKPLVDICGLPMIQRVWQQACKVGAIDVVIATDDPRIQTVCESFGARVVMTRDDHESGTDRLQEVAAIMQWAEDEVIVNVQGDEPLIPPAVIHQVAKNCAVNSDVSVSTLSEPIERYGDFVNPNVVKVVADQQQRALYFSRAPMPWPRDDAQQLPHCGAFRHIGIYAYRVHVLHQFVSWAPAPLELTEKLEQLRFMDHGHRIHVEPACALVPGGVDTPEDLAAVRAWFEDHPE
ncbi:MAG: 3-deoxy-manno-octulosonate cytidylyltransferase [Pseudomonadales bacterium]|jgi:3-deoxy-manno-octulosonate cytidylyltransferase (CMP-KDO synthetase)